MLPSLVIVSIVVISISCVHAESVSFKRPGGSPTLPKLTRVKGRSVNRNTSVSNSTLGETPYCQPFSFPANDQSCQIRFDIFSSGSCKSALVQNVPNQNVEVSYLCNQNDNLDYYVCLSHDGCDGNTCYNDDCNTVHDESDASWQGTSDDIEEGTLWLSITSDNTAESGHLTCSISAQCNSQYEGPDCTTPICNPGCSSHGKCTSPDHCSCDAGWKGKTCSEPICSTPCVHGTCTDPDTCTCTDGWEGEICSHPICGNNCGSSEERGACVSPGVCSCNQGWSGDTCNTANSLQKFPLFFGMPVSLRCTGGDDMVKNLLQVSPTSTFTATASTSSSALDGLGWNEYDSASLFRIFSPSAPDNFTQLPPSTFIGAQCGLYNVFNNQVPTQKGDTLKQIDDWSQSECCTACTGMPSCTGWLFEGDSSICTLVSGGVTNGTPSPGSSFGVKGAVVPVVFASVTAELEGQPRYLQKNNNNVDIGGTDPTDPACQWLLCTYPAVDGSVIIRPLQNTNAALYRFADGTGVGLTADTSVTSQLGQFNISNSAVTSFVQTALYRSQVLDMLPKAAGTPDNATLTLLTDVCKLLPAYQPYTSNSSTTNLIDGGVVSPLQAVCQAANNVANGLDIDGSRYDYVTSASYTDYAKIVTGETGGGGLLGILESYESIENQYNSKIGDYSEQIKLAKGALATINQDEANWKAKIADNSNLLTAYGAEIASVQKNMQADYRAVNTSMLAVIASMKTQVFQLKKKIEAAKAMADFLGCLDILKGLAQAVQAGIAFYSGDISDGCKDLAGVGSDCKAAYDELKNKPGVKGLEQQLAATKAALSDVSALQNMTNTLRQLEAQITLNASLPDMLPKLYAEKIDADHLHNYLTAFMGAMKLPPKLNFYALDMASDASLHFKLVLQWYQLAMKVQHENAQLEVLKLRAKNVEEAIADASRAETAAAKASVLVSHQRGQQLALTLKYMRSEMKQYELWALKAFPFALPTLPVLPTGLDLVKVQSLFSQAVQTEKDNQESLPFQGWWKYTANQTMANFLQFQVGPPSPSPGPPSPSPDPSPGQPNPFYYTWWFKVVASVAGGLLLGLFLSLWCPSRDAASQGDLTEDSSEPLLEGGVPATGKCSTRRCRISVGGGVVVTAAALAILFTAAPSSSVASTSQAHGNLDTGRHHQLEGPMPTVTITVPIPYINGTATTIYYDVRLVDVRAVLITEGGGNPMRDKAGQSALSVFLEQSGRAQFLDSSLGFHGFVHESKTLNGYSYDMNTTCPLSKPCGPPTCSDFINYSPFGVWTIGVPLGQNVDLRSVTAVELHFNLVYSKKGHDVSSMFERLPSVQYPFRPCDP
mmetsp:Transcript_13950/g.27005  ORF Transcript_13950/g.27005 Transcript_13950/m.27005 type:complete len:1338 (+) Transcript_13950:60-4073(+)